MIHIVLHIRTQCIYILALELNLYIQFVHTYEDIGIASILYMDC